MDTCLYGNKMLISSYMFKNWRIGMSEYVFLFDLDATITKVEILPEISAEIGKIKK